MNDGMIEYMLLSMDFKIVGQTKQIDGIISLLGKKLDDDRMDEVNKSLLAYIKRTLENTCSLMFFSNIDDTITKINNIQKHQYQFKHWKRHDRYTAAKKCLIFMISVSY